ncbi:eukaryotic translation initiation factor [Pseudozyma hubeiensis SY62]|uniref:Eukaryotic translation initiation factor n=1 Tax=Pseudozyma hubeiensis (strain SY62) TaxID=1305764 RepID=R9PAW6_PSEHS|nr:eukaryotic translation initiation factor [Pseudozyma hubeiensis SY62]GAC95225.1 eukaryotic translation initiation factor [Pseudozyma hubeiensis SY62]
MYSTSSPSGSPRPYFAQHLPGTMSPYRDASARYTNLGSPRISSLSRDATAALKGSNYPTSSSRPTSPAPGSRSPSPSSDSGDSRSSSSSRGNPGHGDDAQHAERPLLTRGDSSFRRDIGPSHRESYNDDPPAQNAGSPSAAKRANHLQPIDTKGDAYARLCSWRGKSLADLFIDRQTQARIDFGCIELGSGSIAKCWIETRS